MDQNAIDDVIFDMTALIASESSIPHERSIYSVPVPLRSVDDNAYTPRMVSIGPMHHGNKNLLDMEHKKDRYLKDFVGRNPKVNIQVYVKALADIAENARDCYSSFILLDYEFLKTLLLDGCFLIELFLKWNKKTTGNLDDPIFNETRMRAWLRYDLLLLENQVPFFVLQKLFELHDSCSCSLIQLFLDYFEYFGLNAEKTKVKVGKCSQPKHFVDLLLLCYLPQTLPLAYTDANHPQVIPSLTELDQAGMKFMVGAGDVLDIKLDNGVLRISPIFVSDETNSLFRNMIAMEQCGKSDDTYFTDYAIKLDCLIKTPADVALLSKYKIITSFLGCDADVSDLINKLRIGVITNEKKNYYGDLFVAINGFMRRRH